MPWLRLRASKVLMWFDRLPHGIDLEEVDKGANEEGAALRGQAPSSGDSEAEVEE